MRKRSVGLDTQCWLKFQKAGHSFRNSFSGKKRLRCFLEMDHWYSRLSWGQCLKIVYIQPFRSIGGLKLRCNYPLDWMISNRYNPLLFAIFSW